MTYIGRIRDLSTRMGDLFDPAAAATSAGRTLDSTASSSINISSGSINTHTQMFVQMLNVMINMLGPDMSTFTEVVSQLGAKHSSYDVKSVDFPVMGKGTYMREKKQRWNGTDILSAMRTT